MSSKVDNSYRGILRGTSIFGSVQLFQMVMGVVKMKLVALFLGAAGMGVASLYTSAAAMFQKFGSLGLNLAVTKEISAHSENAGHLGAVIVAARRLLAVTSVVGGLLCLATAPWLSEWTFGNRGYVWGCALLGLAVCLQIYGTGYLSILQGLHEMKRIAKASVTGSVFGLVCVMPLYWIFGVRAIVPGLILLALVLAVYYRRALRQSIGTLKSAGFSWHTHGLIVRGLLAGGMVLLAGDLVNSVCNWALNLIIRRWGDLVDVGLYQAASALTLQISGVVFTTMAMDYLPRLSAVAGDNSRMADVVNRQIIVVGLLMAPIGVGVAAFSPLAVRLLYSSEFMAAVPLLRWLALGVVVRALMYPLGYIAFAKDNRRLYFWMEAISLNILTLALSVAGYMYAGLAGLGVATVIDCSICMVLYCLVNRHCYSYSISPGALASSAYALLSTGCAVWAAFCLAQTPAYIAGGAVLLCTSLVSGTKLREMLKKG